MTLNKKSGKKNNTFWRHLKNILVVNIIGILVGFGFIFIDSWLSEFTILSLIGAFWLSSLTSILIFIGMYDMVID